MRRTPFQKACYDLTHSEKVMDDRLFGRRVSLYKLRGVIGTGNFSQVRFGIHDLTKGETSFHFHITIAINRKIDKLHFNCDYRPPPPTPMCVRYILYQIN